jgi:hypothetical protein
MYISTLTFYSNIRFQYDILSRLERQRILVLKLTERYVIKYLDSEIIY